MHALIYAWRIIRTGFLNFFRNGWLSVAATTVMVITLFTISIFTVLNIGITAATKSIQSKIDIEAFFVDAPNMSKVAALQAELRALPQVKSVHYVDEAEALQTYRNQNKDNPELLKTVTENGIVLPTSIKVSAKDPTQLGVIKQVLDKPEYRSIIHDSSYRDEKEKTTNRLIRITNFVKTGGLVLSAIFIATSLLVIFNTIRIAIFTRREEIEIMKLVGATATFIRWPFIIEGATYGAIATAVSLLIQYLAISLGAPAITRYLGLGNGSNLFSYFADHLPFVILLQLLVGVLIGVASSYIAIRRYLRIATLHHHPVE